MLIQAVCLKKLWNKIRAENILEEIHFRRNQHFMEQA